jgi:hypothetical protein
MQDSEAVLFAKLYLAGLAGLAGGSWCIATFHLPLVAKDSFDFVLIRG